MFGEDLPLETNRVTPDDEVTGPSEFAAAPVNRKPHERISHSSANGVDRIFDAANAAGAPETNVTGFAPDKLPSGVASHETDGYYDIVGIATSVRLG